MNIDDLIDRTIQCRDNPILFNLPTYVIKRKPLPPIGMEEWQEVTARLGFDPGEFITKLYTSVASGRIGPGYGLLSTDGDRESLVALYLEHHSWNELDETWYWPEGLLPLIEWGCNIYSCVDCTSTELPVIRYDPNLCYDPSSPEGDERTVDWRVCFHVEASSIIEWWMQWLNGKDLWLMGGRFLPQWTKYDRLIPIQKRQHIEPNLSVPMPGQLAFDFYQSLQS